jgi:uncharacterized membrane protein YGL010W
MSTFEWTRRMGIHQAYHRGVANKVIHGICIPLQLWGIVHLLTSFLNPFLVVMLFAPLYLLCDVVAGGSFALFLLALSLVGRDTHYLWGPVLFVAANLFQTKVGHSLEAKGRDDTKQNMDAFKKSKNPIPLLLIFFYHWVELFFLLGYKPDVRREVDRFQRDHEQTFS